MERPAVLSNVTQILNGIPHGGAVEASELLPMVYAELRRLAGLKMKREIPGQTLQPTALVHEAYLRLMGEDTVKWDSRSHFFAAAAEAMRRILIENARRRKSAKRGGDLARYEIAEGDAIVDPDDLDRLLDLDDALAKLASEDPELARLVELRYFAGLTIEEVAEVMGVSSRTVRRNWAFVRAWFGRELEGRSTS